MTTWVKPISNSLFICANGLLSCPWYFSNHQLSLASACLVLHFLWNYASNTTPRIDDVSGPSRYQVDVSVHYRLPCREAAIHTQIEPKN